MKTKQWVLLIISMIILMFIFSGINSELEDSKYPEFTKEEKAKRLQLKDAPFHAQRFIKRKLKSPSTAEFPSTSDAKVEVALDNTYIITSYVDAQNSFGAILRKYYVAEIKYLDNEKVELVSYQFVD